MKHIKNFENHLNEDTSATGGPGGAVTGGGVVNSQPSSLPGVTTDPTYSATGGVVGTGDPSFPYNAGGKFVNVNAAMGSEHGPRTGKKSRTKKLDMKALKNIFAKRQDYTAGQGNVDRKSKVMDFDAFQKVDINQVKPQKESISSAILAGALAVAHSANIQEPNTPPHKDTISEYVPTYDGDLERFLDTLEETNPEIFVNGDMSVKQPATVSHLPLSILTDTLYKYNKEFETKLSLSDLNMLSKPGLPIRINYFYVRGLDDVNKGPYLMPIMNINYDKAVSIAGHDVVFNFTRINGINTIGTKINF